MFRRIGWLVVALPLFWVAGCSQPQLEPGSLRLAQGVRTAVSARNPEWLEQAAQKLAAQHAQGVIDESGYRALQEIIELGRNEDWQAAEQRCLRLLSGQRPKQAHIDRLPTAARS